MKMSEQGYVRLGAESLAAAEKAAKDVQAALTNIPSVLMRLHELSLGLGYLEASELSAEAKALMGLGANLEMELFTFHRRLTERAQDLGIDLPQPRSGVR